MEAINFTPNLTTTPSHHLNLNSHHLNITPSHHQISPPHHLTISTQ
ncbi:MAG: hypothetical protein SOY19_08410 [Prevotella sp.]|nr:hypothetical protein [Leyella stercorea]MDY4198785.1 hypothetical protein [Prevotella sp.]